MCIRDRPTLLFLQEHPDHRVVAQALRERAEGSVREAVRLIAGSSAISGSLAEARRCADEAVAALALLPEGPYRQALEDLARFVVERRF